MTNTFETTLANIVSQKSDFESRDEKAVEMFVVMPLLKQLGWNTENVSETYPQRVLSDGGKVDFDLQIDGESRILIEVKKWGYPLNDGEESQLEAYCQSARPKLAVLTSGRDWRLYLAPTAARGTNSKLKRFEEVDVTDAKLATVEKTFRQFLARDSMVDFKPTLSAAKELYRRLQDYQEQKRSLIKAWDELANDKRKLAELVSKFAEDRHISTNQENVMRFLDSLHGSLVNEVPTKTNSKPPASFTIFTSPTDKKEKTHGISRPRGWNNFLLEVCELMQSRHHGSFHQVVLSMPGWFSESKDAKFKTQVGNEGIYTRWENSAVKIRETCYEIVTKFDYPRESLVIKDSKGEEL